MVICAYANGANPYPRSLQSIPCNPDTLRVIPLQNTLFPKTRGTLGEHFRGTFLIPLTTEQTELVEVE